MVPPPSIDKEKKKLRQECLDRRGRVGQELRDSAGYRLAQYLIAFLKGKPQFKPGIVLAAYWPLKSEISTESFLNEVHRFGIRCVLPVVSHKEAPLSFREWVPETKLVEGEFGVLIPPECNEILSPQIIITPLVAFDRGGRRLGSGGGFYDRTLELLRRNDDILALGAAFACQQVEYVPTGSHDQKLDGVVTENGPIDLSS